MTGEQLLIKTIKQCNAFEARVIELEAEVVLLKSEIEDLGYEILEVQSMND